jgi:hypothetical protein
MGLAGASATGFLKQLKQHWEQVEQHWRLAAKRRVNVFDAGMVDTIRRQQLCHRFVFFLR